MSYTTKNKQIKYLSKENIKISKAIRKELEADKPDKKKLDNSFAKVKKNQLKIQKLIRQKRLRTNQINKKKG